MYFLDRMKKEFLLLAGILLLMTACVKVDTVDYSENTPLRIRASIPHTRLSVGETGKTSWDSGDELAVFADGQALLFTLVEGAGTAEGIFVTQDEYRGKHFDGVAVFPYDKNASLQGKTLQFELQSSYKDGQKFPVPMVGTSSGNGDYSFRSLTGLLRVRYANLPSAAQSVRVTASHSIAGVFSLEDYTSSVLSIAQTEGNNVVVAALPKVRPSNEAWVDIPVPEGTLSSVKAELLDVDGNVLDEQRSRSSKTFSVGKVLPLETISVTGEKIRLEWIWDSGSLTPFRSNFPAIDDSGNVYVTSNEGFLYKIDRDGKLVWKTLLSGVGGRVGTSPSVEKDGSAIYLSAGQNGSGAIIALNADGSVKWTFKDYPWSDVTSNRNFWQSIIGVGENNLYVPVGTLCTLLTIDKETGKLVSYGSGTTDGSRGNIGGLASGSAIGLQGTVSAMAQEGAYTWRKDLLDHPTSENPKYGGYAPWGYLDMWPGWYTITYDNHGVLPTKKGSSGKDVLISCMQEEKGRFDICCYPVSFALDNVLKAHDNATTKYYWRHQIGTNTDTATSPALQDQGGIVMGHDNMVLIIPMKDRPNAASANVGAGGLYAVWMGRAESDGGSASWRVVTPGEDVSGAAAVDNNGNVHFATDTYYYIVKPNALTDSYVVLEQIHLKNFIMASGLSDFPQNDKGESYTGVWTSVKIAEGGRIYLNVNLSSTRGVTCCFSYPGVTGPDKTSSWPQKGADQYNSCNQQL